MRDREEFLKNEYRDPEDVPAEENEDLVWNEEMRPGDDDDVDWQEENDRRKLYDKLRVKSEVEPEEPEEEEPEVPKSRTERLNLIREETRKTEAIRNGSAQRMRERERKRDRLRSFLVVLAILSVMVSAALLYLNNYHFTTYSVDGELSLGAVGTSKLYRFANGNVVLGNDTVLYIEDLDIVWSSLVNLEHPLFASEGAYFALADRGGYQLYICDQSGLLSSVRVSRKIRCIDISAAGVVAVSTESSDSSYVSYFDRFGTKISVEVKTVLDVSGYPVSLTVSPDGQKLLTVYYCVQNGIGESRLAVYDFKNGKQDKSYVTASYEDFYNSDTYLVDCRFFDDRHAVAVGDNELVFLDIQKASVERTTVELKEKTRSVLFTEKHVLLISESDGRTVCRVYDGNGKVESEFLCPSSYELIIADERFVLFKDKEELRLYNVSGVERYVGELIYEPQTVAFMKGNSLLVNTGSKFQKITPK